MFEVSPGYSLCASDDGTVLHINDDFRERLGIQTDGRKNVEDLLTVGSRIYYQSHLLPIIKLQDTAYEVFLSFKTITGESFPALLNVKRISHGDVYMLYFAGIQIEQRNKFEKELLESKDKAEKALLEDANVIRLRQEAELSHKIIEENLQKISRLTNQLQQIDKVLSHDLQEPLRKISFFASMIENPNEVLDPNITKILKSSDRLRNLLNRMQRLHVLDYRKSKSATIDLNVVIENAKKRESIAQEFLVEYSNCNSFTGDEELLTNLFEELFDNSLKFKQEGIDLQVNVSTEYIKQNIYIETEDRYKYEDFIRIIYKDNGTGFDSTYSKLIFDVFKKVHNHEGLGIGLSYVKRIVELHNGSIEVKSAPQQGTTFIIVIPLQR